MLTCNFFVIFMVDGICSKWQFLITQIKWNVFFSKTILSFCLHPRETGGTCKKANDCMKVAKCEMWVVNGDCIGPRFDSCQSMGWEKRTKDELL